MKPKFLLLISVVALPLLYWISNNAAEFVLADTENATKISTNACQFGQDVCEVSIDQQDYLVSVVNDFSAGQAIQIEVEPKQLTGREQNNLESVHFLLQGKTMYMGISETQLQFVDGKWVGLLRIPFCTTQVMLWQLDMTLQESGDNYLARYEFEMRQESGY
ncbi:hypothetical protein OA92_10430 [Marinomonas sp. SBI22]|uniref:hypothetical protein n=1 Tax=unclassified Marinomonas TaxID=196814 RepID=UPI0007AFBB56|nr:MULTISPECIES: hypothetical protein [unclassified Marinomonas]KZM43149.1 hypothetical protein OA92_10430 [Marinomonas sp. SBI22]KZM44720.1 hypothetical protein OA91_09855 [Marinomonas sp. SBI8L]